MALTPDTMPPATRITIRLSPDLAARLVAHGGPLADVVRQALDAYLGGAPPPWLPRLPGTAAIPAATVAAIEARLEGFTQRLTALEAPSASGSQTAVMAARIAQVAGSVAAMQAYVARIEERLTAIEAVAATGSHQQLWQPPRQPPLDAPQLPSSRGAMRRRIVALLQEHPEGLSPAQMRNQLGTDRDLNNTCWAMTRDGLLQRVGRGRYVIA